MRLIKNGNVWIDDHFEQVDVLLDEGKIKKIGENLEADCEILDAKGYSVLPGLVDVHVHLREPGHEEKEKIATGSRAAAHGGYTTIFCMPNVIPFPDDVDTMKAYLELIEKESVVHTHPYATITTEEAGKEVVDMHALKELGIRWYSDDGVGVANDEIMLEAMKKAKEENVIIAMHTEDMKYRKPLASVFESDITAAKGWLGIPNACETAQLERDLSLVEQVHNKYHACHISAKSSVEAIRLYKAKGLDVSGEVTAHHLLLEDKDVQGPNWKMNPPLKGHEDRMSVIEALEDGTLDFIANDHAPHTSDEKKRVMEKAPFGIVSLETAFPLLYTEFVIRQKRWTLQQLIDWMSVKPAARFGISNIAHIKEGYNADLFLVDLNERYVIDSSKFESMGKNTPFNGWEVQGKVKETLVDGKTVWKG